MQKTEHTPYTGINRWIRSRSLQTLLTHLHDGTFRDFMDDWKWIFSFSGRYRKTILLYTVLGLLGSTLSLGASWVSRILINVIVGKKFHDLWFLLIAMIVSTVLSFVLTSALSRLGLKLSIWVNNDIQADMFHRVIDADWSQLHGYSNGDLLNRFDRDTGTVASNAVSWIPNLIITLYSFLATFFLLFRTDPNMAYIALGSAPILFLMSRFLMRRLREYKRRVLEMNSEMTAFEVETFYNIDTIKSFGVTDHSERKLRTWQDKFKRYNLDYNRFEIRARLWISLTSAAVSMLAFGYCLWRLWTDQIQYGDMTFFLQQRSALTGRFNTLVGTIPGMITAAVSAHRVRELTELSPEVHDPAAFEVISRRAAHGLTVTMEDVSFSYPPDQTVYEHGEFIARPGEIVAVLGPSGEGKTTMLRLLLGLLQPDSGAVTLTDRDGSTFPVNADLRQLFSYVPQGNSLLAGTVAENLRLVKEDATEEEMTDALKTACAWEFIEALPDGIHAAVGEKGGGFSEGQAQRIAIARALLRDAPILLLDEATSALDTDTEHRVLENILLRCPEKTCIVSTHRKSILSRCKRVYCIRDRRAQEITEDELPEFDEF